MKSSSLAISAFWLGVIAVIGTHIYMLAVGVPASQMTAHAIINLVAVVLIILGWMKR